MITLVFGVPGSGKTYWAVHTIRKKALEPSDAFFKVRDDTLLITNLKLKLDAEENYIYVEEWEQWLQYLNVQFWHSWNGWHGKKVFIVMDECQRFFAIAKENPEVWFYLQYHRHFGTHNFIFITQTPKSIPGKLYELCEFVIEAVPKSVNIVGAFGFRYRVLNPLDKSMVLRRFHLPFDHITFYLYQDMVFKEEDDMKPQNAFLRPVALVVFMFFLTFLFAKLFFSHFTHKAQAIQTQTTQTHTRAKTITYEDLITEKPQEPPKQEPPGAKEEPGDYYSGAKEEPGGYYYIAVEKTRPSADSPNEDVLNPSVKVIEIP
jgi:zona occludens toxin (predicted ATPase)